MLVKSRGFDTLANQTICQNVDVPNAMHQAPNVPEEVGKLFHVMASQRFTWSYGLDEISQVHVQAKLHSVALVCLPRS